MSISNSTLDEFRQHIQTTSVRQLIRETWRQLLSPCLQHKTKTESTCYDLFTHFLRHLSVVWTSQSESSLPATGRHSRQHPNAPSPLLPDTPLKSSEGSAQSYKHGGSVLFCVVSKEIVPGFDCTGFTSQSTVVDSSHFNTTWAGQT